MMRFASLDETVVDNAPNHAPGLTRQVRGFIGATHGQYAGEVGPQAFLVEVGADGGLIRPHFHPTRQFQVFVSGGGRIGKTPVEPFTFHYVDPQSPYGPIVPDERGIGFFTLRADHTAETHWMPEARAHMTRRPGRNIVSAMDAGEAAIGVETLIAPHPDGLAAYGLRLDPRERALGPPVEDSGGQYYIVRSGSLLHGGREYGALSLAFVAPEDGSLSVTAGEHGAEALITQFPREDDA